MIGFWSQCIILLGYHFTGARSYILLVYHFTETSFYWNNFVKISVSFLSVSFYDSTFKIFNTNRYIFCCIGTMLQYYKCNSQRFLVNRQRNTYLLLGDNRLQYCLHCSPRFLEFERETAFGILQTQSRVTEMSTHT